MKDSLVLVSKIDTTAIAIQNINNQSTSVDKTIGDGLVVLWIAGLIFTLLIFKRPSK